MNKKDIIKLVEVFDNPKRAENPEALELAKIAKEIKEAKTEIIPNQKFKEKLKDKLYDKYLTQRKEKKTMPEVTSYKKPFWKNWAFVTAAAAVVVLAVVLTTWFVTRPERKTEEAVKVVTANLFFKQGNVEVKSADGNWETAETNTTLEEGSSIRTKEGAKAILDLENDNIFRLNEEGEVTIAKLNSDEIVLTQDSGTSYNRVKEGTNYTVKALSAEITAKGTAFGVEANEKASTVTIPVLQSQVEVEVKEDDQVSADLFVDEGKVCLVDLSKKGEGATEVQDISQDKLESDWYQWNMEKDKEGGYPLPSFNKAQDPSLEISEPQDGSKIQEDHVTVTGNTDKDAKVYINGQEIENKDGAFSKTVNLNKGANFIEVKAVDPDNRETVKKITVYYQEGEEQEQSGDLSLSVQAKSDGIHLSWSKYSGSDFKYYKVVRSETNPNPRYPDDGHIAAIKDQNSGYHVNKSAANGKSYYYRICAVKTTGEVVCGNVVQVTAATEQANTSIKASAQATAGGVNIFWEMSGTTPSGFKIVISESPNPTYPEAPYKQYVSSETRSYTWSGLPNKTLHVRIGAYGSGSCYAYSNDVTVAPIDKNDPPSAVGLSAQVKADGVYLSWTKNNDPDFKYYKIVRSETNPAPTYPADGYIYAASRDQLNYLDKGVNSTSPGTHYYSVCTVDQSGQVTRSNVITVVNGVIK
jgi:hypothetical protein